MNWEVATPLIVGILVLVGTVLTVRAGRRNSLDTRTVADQARQDKRITELEQKQEKQEKHQRILEDYIYELRDHIAVGKPPPPPDWPEELRRA